MSTELERTKGSRGGGQAAEVQRHLTAILENTTDYVSTSRPDKQLLYLNRAGRRMVGVSEEEDITRLHVHNVHPEWATKIIENEGIPAAIREGVWRGETALLTRDGREIPVSQVIIAHKAEGGLLQYLSTIMRDITEHKRAEEARLESNATIRGLLDAAPESLFLMDPDGTIRAANEIVAKRLGRTVEELEGHSIWEVLPPEVTRSRRPRIEAIIRSGKPDRFEDRRGASFIYNIVHPVLNEQGQVSRVAVLGVDITERKRAEEVLQASETKFKRLYDADLIGIIFWDTAGNITGANREFLRIVGYTEEDVLSGRARWKDMTPPEYAPLDEKALKQMAETGSSTPFEKKYIRKDGSRVPVVIGATLFKGAKDFGICFVLDISERKRAEEALNLSAPWRVWAMKMVILKR